MQIKKLNALHELHTNYTRKMEWKKNILIGLLLVFVGALLGMMLTRSLSQIPTPEPIVIRDTITEVEIDTQYFAKPEPYKVEVRDTVYIDKPYTGHVFVHESKWFSDGSTYDMQVSGINVQLDYINTYNKTEVRYITEKEYVYVQSQKWSLWVNAGYMFMANKSHLPISGELRYRKNEYREYNVKIGNDILTGQTYVLGGISVNLFHK